MKVVAEKSAEDMDGNGTKVRNDASLEKNDFLGKYGTIPDLQEIIIPEALESKAEYERTLISWWRKKLYLLVVVYCEWFSIDWSRLIKNNEVIPVRKGKLLMTNYIIRVSSGFSPVQHVDYDNDYDEWD